MGNFTDDADRWDEFKKLLSQEDKASMESILKKTRINTDTGVDLSTTLTKEPGQLTLPGEPFFGDFAEKRID
jgi:hypothetical protein